jgi:glutaminyl-tRNA synthetase
MVEPSLKHIAEGTRYQFLRKGYFCVDKDTTPEHLVFNEVVGLRDTWAKVKKD